MNYFLRFKVEHSLVTTKDIYMKSVSDYGIFFEPSAATPLDYDVIPLYSIFVVCNDGLQDSEVKEFQVSIEPNEDPVPDIPRRLFNTQYIMTLV